MKRAIRISGYERLVAFDQSLGIAQHMRFTDLMLHPDLIGHRLEAIGIIGDEYRGSYALGNWQSLVLKRLHVLGRQLIDG